MKALQKQLETLLAEVVSYNEKPNKSISGRIRAQLGTLKKNVTGIRADLVAADKKGY